MALSHAATLAFLTVFDCVVLTGIDAHDSAIVRQKELQCTLVSLDTLNLDFKYIKTCSNDALFLIASPAHWRGSDWLIASLVAAGGFGIYQSDSWIQKTVLRNRTRFGDATASTFKMFGDGPYLLASTGVFYLAGMVLKNQNIKSTTLLCAESVLLARGCTEILKQGFHRYRPSESASSREWRGPAFSVKHLSFPSGHTTAASALASALAVRYQESPLVGIIACALAACTGLSRINDNEHWASDVFTGYVIGWYCGRNIAKSHLNYKNYVFSPVLIGERAGISISLNY
jgi:membrane-associated phospholipid phosphatase